VNLPPLFVKKAHAENRTTCEYNTTSLVCSKIPQLSSTVPSDPPTRSCHTHPHSPLALLALSPASWLAAEPHGGTNQIRRPCTCNANFSFACAGVFYVSLFLGARIPDSGCQKQARRFKLCDGPSSKYHEPQERSQVVARR